ncbi:MAG: hypothetical protein AAF721_20890 [Myxococcota bacterium]
MVARLLRRRKRRDALAELARLTVNALRRAHEEAAIEAYLGAYPVAASEPSEEALRFFEYVASTTTDLLVASVTRFERAIVDASEERERVVAMGGPTHVMATPNTVLRLHPWRVVVLPARAEEVIVSVALGECLTLLDRSPVVVGPGLPSLWRDATRAEDVLCSWLVRPRTMKDLERVFPGFAPTVLGLIEAGVVACGSKPANVPGPRG